MRYDIKEVDGVVHKETIDALNGLSPDIFPELQPRHLTDGYWWLAFYTGFPDELIPIAFAGLVPFIPFENVGYLKRCFVLPDHLGHGLQFRMLTARILKARQLGYTHLVAECSETNGFSLNNLRKSGFDLCEPEQKWGAANSLYWLKTL